MLPKVDVLLWDPAKRIKESGAYEEEPLCGDIPKAGQDGWVCILDSAGGINYWTQQLQEDPKFAKLPTIIQGLGFRVCRAVSQLAQSLVRLALYIIS